MKLHFTGRRKVYSVLPFLAVSISSSVQRELSFISRLAVKKIENHQVREGGGRGEWAVVTKSVREWLTRGKEGEREIREEKKNKRVGGRVACAACQWGTAAWVARDCLF